MTQTTNTTNVENDDLTCPITLELFRDPVIAKDGRVYEREAITRWIFEHGTSPFTREPLDINDLRPDNRLKRLAAQRRNSTVSYNARDNIVTLPPLRRVPRNNRRVAPEQVHNIVRENDQPKDYSVRMICCMITLIVIGITITIGIVLSVNNTHSNSGDTITVTVVPQITSIYSSSLTNNSSVFIRPGSFIGRFYYKAIQVIVSNYGYYQFNSFSRIDMYGLLYAGYFDATNPNSNLWTYDDDSGGNQQFKVGVYLQPGNYTLVATTYNDSVIGSFYIISRGPATVTFQ